MGERRELVLMGCGQMGSAIVRGLMRGDSREHFSLTVCDVHTERAEQLASELEATARAPEAFFDGGEQGRAQEAGRVFLIAVKPGDVQRLLEDLSVVKGDVVISVAAGLRHDTLVEWIDEVGVQVVRTMPNTPCLVGAGVIGIYGGSPQARELAREVFGAVGEVVELKKEDHFDGLTAISGSGPAYMFLILEALADGGVLTGLDRATSRKLAVATMAGAAALVSQGEVHTAELKDRVASPGGTTIAALRELERHGVRDALISAVEAAAQRSKQMG